MHQRFFSWLLFCALFAAVSLHAQGPGKFDPQNNAGLIKVAKVSGKVTKILNGVETDLKFDEKVEQTAKVKTGPDGSVILSFSNGATTKLGNDTELVIEEYLQDPFSGSISVAKLDQEPSPSRTKLFLNKGEIVGEVKRLREDQNSSFTVQTPVGAAGVRGTVFRIVFRPSTNGQAFFQLTTTSGRVDYSQSGQGGGTTPGVTAQGTANVQVPQGQEVVIVDIDVTTNAQGQIVATVLPPPPSTTNPVSSTTAAQVTSVAVEIATAVQNAVYTAPTPGSQGGGGSTTGSMSGNPNPQNKEGQQQGQGNQGQGQGQGQNEQGQNQQGQGQNQQGQQSFTTQNASGTIKSIPAGQLQNTSSP